MTLLLAIASAQILPAPGRGYASSFSGANGKFAFWQDVLGDTNIYSQNPDGSGLTQLTNTRSPTENLFPAWSPDGGRIAFERYEGDRHVFVMGADGSGQTDLGVGAMPTWSPDGTKIAFSGSNLDRGIWVMKSDGSNPDHLTAMSDIFPSWSPDGANIAFLRFTNVNPGYDLFVMNAGGSGQTDLVPSVVTARPTWSPDGSKIAFVANVGGNGDIFTINPDGTGQANITNDPASDESPVWSPDGTKIAFDSSRAGGGVFSMNPDGSGVDQLGAKDEYDWQPLQLTLSVSATKVVYKRSVTVTAHLIPFQITPNPTVSIYETPYGGSKTLVASGPVDGSGNFKATATLYRKTTFVAEWSGDADHPAGGVSNFGVVNVYPIITGKLSGYYGTSGAYRLYHYTSNCPNFGKGCPTYTVSVIPNHRGQYIYITLQVYVSGAWRTALAFKARLNSLSRVIELFVYQNRGVIGIPTRARAQFKGDADHLGARSGWSYFKVTN